MIVNCCNSRYTFQCISVFGNTVTPKSLVIVFMHSCINPQSDHQSSATQSCTSSMWSQCRVNVIFYSFVPDISTACSTVSGKTDSLLSLACQEVICSSYCTPARLPSFSVHVFSTDNPGPGSFMELMISGLNQKRKHKPNKYRDFYSHFHCRLFIIMKNSHRK